jgi:adenylosuccinate synthase
MKCLSDAQVHPNYLGNVMLTIRTYPIRVGNIYKDDELIGYSGPFYPDSKELTWGEIKEPAEKTTVTNRVRRVASFSKLQYERALHYIKPTHVFLNFSNYLKDSQYVKKLICIFKETKLPDYIGVGSNERQIIRIFNEEHLTEILFSIIQENTRKEYGLKVRY